MHPAFQDRPMCLPASIAEIYFVLRAVTAAGPPAYVVVAQQLQILEARLSLLDWFVVGRGNSFGIACLQGQSVRPENTTQQPVSLLCDKAH